MSFICLLLSPSVTLLPFVSFHIRIYSSFVPHSYYIRLFYLQVSIHTHLPISFVRTKYSVKFLVQTFIVCSNLMLLTQIILYVYYYWSNHFFIYSQLCHLWLFAQFENVLYFLHLMLYLYLLLCRLLIMLTYFTNTRTLTYSKSPFPIQISLCCLCISVPVRLLSSCFQPCFQSIPLTTSPKFLLCVNLFLPQEKLQEFPLIFCPSWPYGSETLWACGRYFG